jgi:GH18 family chitinase
VMLMPRHNSAGNLTEIDQSLNLLWRNNIDPRKVVLGLAFYGRTFQLANSSCTDPGCAYSGREHSATAIVYRSHNTSFRTRESWALHK